MSEPQIWAPDQIVRTVPDSVPEEVFLDALRDTADMGGYTRRDQKNAPKLGVPLLPLPFAVKAWEDANGWRPGGGYAVARSGLHIAVDSFINPTWPRVTIRVPVPRSMLADNFPGGSFWQYHYLPEDPFDVEVPELRAGDFQMTTMTTVRRFLTTAELVTPTATTGPQVLAEARRVVDQLVQAINDECGPLVSRLGGDR